MTREEHVAICKLCTNRKMDIEQGILCKITDDKANFIGECKDFTKDHSVKVDQFIETADPLTAQEIQLSDKALDKLRSEQNLGLGIGTSLLVGLLGAALWAAITVATEFQIGYMAVAIGAGVGYTLRYFGKGIDQIYGISGAVIAVLSCFIGNFLSLIGFVANAEGLGYIETLVGIDYSLVPTAMKESFSIMDILFYGIAGYEGYKFAFRVFTNEDLSKLEN
jgi:hypothetical protein